MQSVHSLVQGQTVYVIDDDVGVRRSLHFLLSTAGYSSWPFSCAFDFLENLSALEPAPILLDIRMPEIDGIDVMVELFKRSIRWPVIVITAYADIPTAVKAVKLGAIELLEKPIEFESLQTSLSIAMETLSTVRVAADVHAHARCLFGSLSPREFEVLVSLTNGMSNKAAAHRLSLSVRTIEMHRANALHKLNVRSISEVLRLAQNAGIQL